MTSIVRIKRRLSQEPVEALLLAAKRFKKEGESASDGDSTTESIGVFKFCGTKNNEETDNLQNISDLIMKGRLKTERLKAKARSGLKLRTQIPKPQNSAASEQRYKILSMHRNVDLDLKVYDLVLDLDAAAAKPDVVTCNNIPMTIEKTETVPDKYVYDFYYIDKENFDVGAYMDGLMSVQPYFHEAEDELDESDSPVDDEDSNDENHCGNQYPTTEEESEPSDDEDLYDRMAGLGLGSYPRGMGQIELSSDDEDFVYAVEDDAYASFKKRTVKHLVEGSISSSEEDLEDDDFQDLDE